MKLATLPPERQGEKLYVCTELNTLPPDSECLEQVIQTRAGTPDCPCMKTKQSFISLVFKTFYFSGIRMVMLFLCGLYVLNM